MLVGIRSGDAVKSLKRDRPHIRSRTTNSVHRSPMRSSKHATGQGDRRSGAVFAGTGRLFFSAIVFGMGTT